jgi:hypothetical protein
MKTKEFRVQNIKTRTCLKGFYIGGRVWLRIPETGGSFCKNAWVAGGEAAVVPRGDL